MKEFVLDALRVDVTYKPGRLRLDWQGASRLQSAEQILPFLDRIAEDAAASRATLEMHFENSTSFNSTTLAAITRFVKSCCERSIGVQISFDPRHRWQKVFVETMCLFDRKDGRFRLLPTT